MKEHPLLAGFNRWLATPLGSLSGFIYLVLAVLVLCDVVLRTAGVAVSGTSELSESLLVIAIFMGLAHTQSDYGNIGMEFVANAMAPPRRRIAKLASLALAMVISAGLLIGTAGMALASFSMGEFTSTSFQLPIWPGKAAICVGFALLLVELALQFADVLRGGSGEAGTPPPESQGHQT